MVKKFSTANTQITNAVKIAMSKVIVRELAIRETKKNADFSRRYGMKIEDFIEHANQLMAMGLVQIEGLPLVDIKKYAEKQIPKPLNMDHCPKCGQALKWGGEE